jgi:hydrogenase 3 maturation protease
VSHRIILGIGNPLGGDDAVGPFVARRINEKLTAEYEVPGSSTPCQQVITAIDAGSAPESYTSVIRRNRPEQLVLVDAADMGLPPGSIRLLLPEKIATLSFSTHSMPLSTLISYVQEFCGQVYIIGIQPKSTRAGSRLSVTVRKSGERAAELILEGRLDEIRALE